MPEKPNGVLLVCVLALCMAGCALFGGDEQQTSPEQIRTIAALTESARETLGYTETPLATRVTDTPPPVFTATPNQAATQTAAAAECDRVVFVRDVNIPDGSRIEAGATFTKTWELKNAGTCAWTNGYSLVFTRGDAMGAPASAPLISSGTVEPNQTVEVSIELKAPVKTGTYRAYFKLRNPGGLLFGLGKDGSGEFYVEISVKSDVLFAEDYCDAEWRSEGEGLPCPGSNSDPRGYVYREDAPRFENGYQDDEPTLILAPPQAGGKIAGRYPAVEVPPGVRFKTIIGCVYGASSCDVKLTIRYQAEGESEKVLGEWYESFNGNVTVLDLDLGGFNIHGKRVSFTFEVNANGANDGDVFFMLQPRLEP